VLRGGTVRAGDAVSVESPAPSADASTVSEVSER
jgi:hypothetical protein